MLLSLSPSASDNASSLNTMMSGLADCQTYTGAPSSSTVPLDPMVDDGAPYSAIGVVELELLMGHSVKMQPLPFKINHFKY